MPENARLGCDKGHGAADPRDQEFEQLWDPPSRRFAGAQAVAEIQASVA